MHLFQITIQRALGDGWPVVAEHTTTGVFLPERREGRLALDANELGAADPGRYGLILGQALFQGEIRTAFDRAFGASGGRLHVLLHIEDPGLRRLHWERLFAPLGPPDPADPQGPGWKSVALDQRVPFSLYLPAVTDQRFPPIGRRDLRALILVAGPSDLGAYQLPPFDIGRAVAVVRDALNEIPSDVLADIDGAGVVGRPTLDALCDRITRERYTLLHIVGHARYDDESGETVLYLSRPDGTAEPVEGKRLLDRLGALGGGRGLPHFAFLSCCEGALPEAEDALGGLGQRFVRDLGMPAVVAMTAPITIETAFVLASGFYAGLRAHGELDRALVEATAPLAERPDVCVPIAALFSRLGGRPLFSDSTDRDLTPKEIADGLEHVERLIEERAPSLQLAFRGHAASVEGTLNAAPAELGQELLDARDDALRKINELCGEALELSFRALALGQSPPPYNPTCPFRGLNPFRREDRPFFFGREALVADLATRLIEEPFLAVLGPSGSGKSSLVLAGLVPALVERLPGLNPVEITPGTDPEPQLEIALSQAPGLLVVDQFEELFTLCTDPAKRRAFLDRMLGQVATRRVVLTMRADFWGECASEEPLRRLMEAHQRLVPPMNREELRGSMGRQASAVGLMFEVNLSERILDDLAGEPGAMPLLQHTLLELWNRRYGRWLRNRAYGEIGGVRGAIARTADSFFDKLPLDEQGSVRDIFLRLTRLGDDPNPGEERRDTRRRVALSDLVPAGGDVGTTKALVARLADTRLVVTGVRKVPEPGGAVRDQYEVEVAHEALIRYWPRLRRWLDDNDESLRLRAGVGDAAREWDRGGRDPDLLVHRGKRLDAVAAIGQTSRLALNALERAYLEECVALREREQRRPPSPTPREDTPGVAIGNVRIRFGPSTRRVMATVLVILAVFAGSLPFLAPRISRWWGKDGPRAGGEDPVPVSDLPGPSVPPKERVSPPETADLDEAPLIYSETRDSPRDAPESAEAAGLPRDQVTVVNMIPRGQSGERLQHSEPSLAVNPADPRQMAASAVDEDRPAGPTTPIFVSGDGGETWRLNSIVPNGPGDSSIANMTLCFSTEGNSLYAAILSVSLDLVLRVLRTERFLEPVPMSVLNRRESVDAPFIQAISVRGRDRLYIGGNDLNATPRSATVDVGDDAGSASPRFTSTRIEARRTGSQDGPQVRPVAHADGTVYAAFYGWRSSVGDLMAGTLFNTSDIIVVRDDHGGLGRSPFLDLIDQDDRLHGQRVARGVKVLFQMNGIARSGQQRINGALSLAVDPRPGQSGTVYLAWGDRRDKYAFVLHVRSSTDRGAHWSPDDLLTVRGATNAALAINSDGTVGLLYQRLIRMGGLRWVSHFRKSPDGRTWSDAVLSDAPADTPTKSFDPYLGGYAYLLSVGKDFYGVFSANNSPDPRHFPSGVRFQRNHDLGARKLLDVDNATEVPISIDPFFFKIRVP